MTILDMITEACIMAKAVPPVSGVTALTAPDEVREMISCAHTMGNLTLLRRYAWPILTKTATTTLVDGQDEYTLPADFSGNIVLNTPYDKGRSRTIALISPGQWFELKYGIGAYNSINTTYRFKRGLGASSLKMLIEPVPTTALGEIVFEYISTHWVYDLNGKGKSKLTADSDTIVWNETLFTLGIVSSWMELNKIDPRPFKRMYEDGIDEEFIAQSGCAPISWGNASARNSFNYPTNYPED